MKKRSFLSIILLLCLLSGCTSTNQNSVPEKEEKPDVSVPEKPILNEWQQAYTKMLTSKLEEISKESSQAESESSFDNNYAFDLYDVDNDSIPELFLSSGKTQNDQCIAYAWIDHKMTEIPIENHFATLDCNRTLGFIKSEYSDSDVTYIRIIEKKNEQFSNVI